MAGRGNPGYGKSVAVRQGVEKLTPRYFELLEVMINGDDKDDRKFSMTELGKLMGKMIPQEIDARVTTISQILNSLENGYTPEGQGMEDSPSLQN